MTAARPPSTDAIKAACAAATTPRGTNYAAAARALGIKRFQLLALVGVQDNRGSPRVSVTPKQAVAAMAKHGSQRPAAVALGISQGTLRNLLARAQQSA